MVVGFCYFGRGPGEVLGEDPCCGDGVQGEGRLLQPAMFHEAVPVGVAVRRPAAGQLARGPHPVEGLEQDEVAAPLQQGAVEETVGFGPCAAVVLALLRHVRRGAGQTVVGGPYAGFPVHTAAFDGHAQHDRFDGPAGLRDLLPATVGEGWDGKAAVGQPVREALADHPHERLAHDG